MAAQSHHCSCPERRKNIVKTDVFIDPNSQPSTCNICTSCSTSNCPFYITEKTIGHNHKWNVPVVEENFPVVAFIESTKDLLQAWQCSFIGCTSRVFVPVELPKK
jgi:hypothetical protein